MKTISILSPLILILLVLTSCSKSSEVTDEKPIKSTPITVTVAKSQDIEIKLESVGIIKTLTEPVISAEIEARVEAIHVDVGSRVKKDFHLTTRQYARIVKKWISSIGLDITLYGTHTMRRTKASLIYKKTKNLRAVQILLGHTKLESTVRYLGVEVDDALELSETTDI